MQKYLLILILLISGCGSVQRVAECVAEETAPLVEPLARLIWDDVRGKRYEPSKFVQDTVIEFAVESGVTTVRCALRRLMTRWATKRSVEHGIAIKIAQDLHDEL